MGKRRLKLAEKKLSSYERAREKLKRQRLEALEETDSADENEDEICQMDNQIIPLDGKCSDEMIESSSEETDTANEEDLWIEKDEQGDDCTHIETGTQTDGCFCEAIRNFCSAAGEDDFCEHFVKVVDTGLMKQGNICFKLFSELLRHLATGKILYTPETLLWWLTGWKSYGNGWLRKMRGTHEKPNFQVPSLTLLRRVCPKSMNLNGPRPPG